jgi:hypothetical protein
VILNTKLCLISNEPERYYWISLSDTTHEGCLVMWCENGGGGDGDSTVDHDDDDDIIASNTNLEYDSILQASMHKSSMLAHKLT